MRAGGDISNFAARCGNHRIDFSLPVQAVEPSTGEVDHEFAGPVNFPVMTRAGCAGLGRQHHPTP